MKINGQHQIPTPLLRQISRCPLLEEVLWAPLIPWTCVKKIKHLAPTGVRTSDSPPRSKSLYCLLYLSSNSNSSRSNSSSSNNNNNNYYYYSNSNNNNDDNNNNKFLLLSVQFKSTWSILELAQNTQQCQNYYNKHTYQHRAKFRSSKK